MRSEMFSREYDDIIAAPWRSNKFQWRAPTYTFITGKTEEIIKMANHDGIVTLKETLEAEAIPLVMSIALIIARPLHGISLATLLPRLKNLQK